MKKHSDNIRVRAGVLAINNLNCFPDVPTTRDGFAELCRRAVTLGCIAVETMADRNYPQEGFLSLTQLSTPVITCVTVDGRATFSLEGGILLWGDRLLTRGSAFSFSDGGDARFAYTDCAVAVGAEMALMKYDTYNATQLDEISDDVLRDLDVHLDRDKLKFAYPNEERGQRGWEDDDLMDMGGYEQVKYMSVYSPDLSEAGPGRAIVVVRGEDDPEHGFDVTYFDRVNNELYDEFLIEFVDRSQPFAYVAVETVGTQNPASGVPMGDALVQVDWYASQFCNETREAIKDAGGYDAVLTFLGRHAARNG